MNAAFIAIGMEADGLRLRPQHRPPARARPRLRRPRVDTCYASTLDDRAAAARGRPRDRRGARARRQGAVRDPARAAQADEAAARCSSTSRSTRAAASRPRAPTTHSDPTYEVDGVTHYCVANMPGAVPITSTYALTNATLPVRAARRRRGRRAGARARTRGWPRASTSSAARSPTSRSPRRPASRTRSSFEALGRGARVAAADGPGRCYHPAPYADDLPARPQGPQAQEKKLATPA